MEVKIMENETIATNQEEATNTVNHEIIIEEISRGKKLLHRYKLFQNNVSIGRGYQNDIILSDPHISPEHLHLTFENEHWFISDQQSKNGTFLGDSKKSADQHKVESGDIITLGKSQIRLVFVDHPVEETISFSPFDSFINLMRHPAMLALSLIIFTIIAATTLYMNNPIDIQMGQLLVPAIGMTLGFCLWPGGVALVSYLTKNEARVMTQIGVSFAIFNLMWFSDFFENIIAFNSSSQSTINMLVAIIPLTLTFCLFWLNSYIGFHMTAKRRVVVSASITALLFGGSLLIQYANKPEFSLRPHYSVSIMTPNLLFASSSSVDTFIENSNKLFSKAQKNAKKKN